MLAKYKIEYGIKFHGHTQKHHHLTDDPVAAEQFLSELLERGFQIDGVSHEGVTLPKNESDRMIKTAAGMLATRHICASLGIDTIEAHHRFGSPA
ncbi:MAG TPA: hypothetical protein VJ252_04440 [Chthoniobacterales bacterium]|jgi:hypothetical protein|nr:hypothetical protein [Chthoniobacterales bacterium]